MALLQARFHLILQAGFQFRDQYEVIRSTVRDNWSDAKRGKITAQEALDNIWQTADYDTLAPARSVLDLEWAHYRLTHRKNERQRIKKQADGMNYRHFVPDTVRPQPVSTEDTGLAKAARLAAGIDAEEQLISEGPPEALLPLSLHYDPEGAAAMERDIQRGLELQNSIEQANGE